ncbi:MAG: hypothetical protein WC959_04895 [Kiritimatiellales bacterium]
MKQLFPYFILLLLTGCREQAPELLLEGFTADATISANAIHAGDNVVLTFSAVHPEGSVVRFPAPGKNREIVVRNRATSTGSITAGVLKTEEQIQFTSFRFGSFPVFSGAAVCVFPDGTETRLELPTPVLHVEKLIDPGDTKLSDIRGIVKPPLRLSWKLLVLLFVGITAVAAGIITLFLLRKPQPASRAPAPPPHTIARQALILLKAKEWIPDPFFTELSFILRTYLENRFSIHAPESTTEELTRMMSYDHRLNLREQQILRDFMVRADLVKFAAAGAEQNVMQTAFSTVESFVEQTKEEDFLTADNADEKINRKSEIGNQK